MAKINLITGSATGSAGAYTYKKWNGIQVMSAKVAKGPRPFNEAQQLNQAKQGRITKFLSFLYAAIAVGFANFTAGTSAWAQSIKENVGAVSGTVGNLVIDFASIKVSRGNLDAPAGLAIADGPNADSINITASSVANGITSNILDTTKVMVYNASKNTSQFFDTNTHRQDLSSPLNVAVAGSEAGDVLHVYVFFVAPDGSSVSNSTYGTFVMQ